MRLSRVAATFLAAALSAHAQLVPPDPQWQEADVPAPAAVKLTGLIALDIPGSTLRFGVDPASVSVGGDGVVRYVVVATKVDKLNQKEEYRGLAAIREKIAHSDLLPFSAVTGRGAREIWQAIWKRKIKP